MWNQGSVFPLLIVTSGAPNTGLFVYRGSRPAKGGLIAQIVAPGTTTDPFGNAVNAIANFGQWSAAGALLRHFGIDQNGNTYLANSSGLTVVFENSLDGSIQFYNSSGQAPGNLIASISPVNGTDPAGNNYDAGIASYSGLSTAVLNASALQLFTGITERATLSTSHFTVFNSSGATIYDVDLARAAQFLYADTSSATQGTLVASQAQVAGTDQFGNHYIGGVAVYRTSPSSAVQLFSNGLFGYTGSLAAGWTIGSAAITTSGDNWVIAANNGATFPGIAIPAGAGAGTALLFADTNGFLRMLTGLAGDTNAYFVAYTSRGGSALPQTISSTSATTITGCSHSVGIGQYAFRARVVYQGGAAAGTANFSVSGPANTSSSINAQFITDTGFAGAGVQNAALGPVISPTLTVGNSIADISGEVTFTASGTMTLQCAEGTAGDTVIIEQARFWLYPLL